MDTFTTEPDLRSRQVKRLIDIAAGRDDGRTTECHYLVLERAPAGYRIEREIEQYRDIERVIANAVDCETGGRHAKWLGAFSATYRDGKLVSIAMVEDMDARIAAAKPGRIDKWHGRGLLREGV